jgi:amicoumacin kinase
LVKGEIDWINYLGDNGINVCRAIPSAKGNYVEAIKVLNSCYLVSSFEKSKGYHIDLSNSSEWNDILFQKWGRTLGKMHSLSKDYTVEEDSNKRNNWNYGTIFSPDLKLGPGENKVLKIWRSLLYELESLPIDKNSYGLVHNDFHYRNFLIDGSKIIVIDFDECAFNWFACDIAIALYDVISVFPINKRNEYEILLIKNFLKGYERENVLDEYWLKLLPKFLKFRQIYSYLFYCTNWNLNALNDGQKEALKTLKCLIENDIPCINANFSDLLI